MDDVLWYVECGDAVCDITATNGDWRLVSPVSSGLIEVCHPAALRTLVALCVIMLSQAIDTQGEKPRRRA